MTILKYRVCILDEFRNEKSVIDCKKYGVLRATDAFRVKGVHKGYQDRNDSITVFVNYEQVFDTKSREEANRFVSGLLEAVSKEFKRDFKEFGHYLKI